MCICDITGRFRLQRKCAMQTTNWLSFETEIINTDWYDQCILKTEPYTVTNHYSIHAHSNRSTYIYTYFVHHILLSIWQPNSQCSAMILRIRYPIECFILFVLTCTSKTSDACKLVFSLVRCFFSQWFFLQILFLASRSVLVIHVCVFCACYSYFVSCNVNYKQQIQALTKKRVKFLVWPTFWIKKNSNNFVSIVYLFLAQLLACLCATSCIVNTYIVWLVCLCCG